MGIYAWEREVHTYVQKAFPVIQGFVSYPHILESNGDL